MGLLRLIKAFRGVKDRYTGTIKCKKDLNEVLKFAKTHPKSGLYHGKFTIVKDMNRGTC